MPSEAFKVPTAPKAGMTPAAYFDYVEELTRKHSTQAPADQWFATLLRRLYESHKPRWDLTKCLAGNEPAFHGKVWFWSDPHFFHRGVVPLRPFSDPLVMTEHLMNRCLAKVGPEDILVFGGDISFGRREAVNAFLESVPAYKIQIVGNHDVQKKKLLRFSMDEVTPCLELNFEGKDFFVSHFPVPQVQLRPGQFSLHGHNHDTPLPLETGDGSRHVSMCVEHTDYEPVELKALVLSQL